MVIGVMRTALRQVPVLSQKLQQLTALYCEGSLGLAGMEMPFLETTSWLRL